MLSNIPHDVVSIVYKYIWRYNYNRCIAQYTQLYIPLWDDNLRMFLNNIRPIAMWRQPSIFGYTCIYSILGGYTCVNPDRVVSALPKNY